MIVREPLSPRLPWAVHLGILAVALLVLPLAPQRQEANGATSTVTLTDEDGPTTKSGSDAQLRDLDRRMKALEQRLDRLMRAMERRTGAPARIAGSAAISAAAWA